jgi:ketosteroid isomerase-like protein
MRPVTLNSNNIQAALRELEQASHQADLVEIAKNFSPDVTTFTPTFTINTTAPTAANIANFIATLITTMQRGGLSTST